MNNFYKIAATIFLAMFIFLFFAPAAIFAAEANFIPQVSIGNFVKGEPVSVEKTGLTFWNYIRAIYKYAIGVVGIVAAVVLMVGGIMWLTAGGNQTRIGEAKAYITASLTGLLLALTSFLILATVNPRLVEFNPIKVTDISEMKFEQSGCCEGACQFKNQSDCELYKGWWKTNDFFNLECVDNQCKKGDLFNCSNVSQGTSCKTGGRNGYCSNNQCSPCIAKGQDCKKSPFGNIFENWRCVGPGGVCGTNYTSGDCDCDINDNCVCK